MTLDLPTLMVMQAFALACVGTVLFFAWLQNRAVWPLALWALADFVAAAGIVSLMLGATLHQPLWSAAGGALLCLESGLIWKAASDIDHRRAPLILVFLGPAIVVIAGGLPMARSFAGAVALSGGVTYITAAALSLWFARRERLFARLPLTGFMSLHALALGIGTVSTFTGSTARDGVPALLSVFGFIYFESVVFALGCTAFVIALIKERAEAASRLAARTDGLTGIANRTALLENATRVLTRSRHEGTSVAVVLFDLDRFKSVNDRFGHALGDAVLRKFCESTAAALRPHDLFGRLGGEEFVVVMPGCSIEVAFVRADRIRAAFADDCRFVDGEQVKATVSGGVAVSAMATDTLDALLEHADAALYVAKAEGRNRIHRATQDAPAATISNVFRVA